MKNWTRVAFAGLLVAVLGAGIVTLAAAGPIYSCPAVWDPVLCENGHVYSNFCYASLAGQTNCVRVGGPIEIQ